MIATDVDINLVATWLANRTPEWARFDVPERGVRLWIETRTPSDKLAGVRRFEIWEGPGVTLKREDIVLSESELAQPLDAARKLLDLA